MYMSAMYVCMRDEYVCHFFQSVSGKIASPVEKNGSLSGNGVSSRLQRCWAVNQLAQSHRHQLLHSYEDSQRLDACL